ncbi:MAG: endonuclease dU [Thermoplasmatota archaeon]
MKPQFRVLGVDDGPFRFTDERAVVVGVVARRGYVDAVMRAEVEVDGDDATQVLVGLVLRSGYADQLEAVMLDGACLGGFNVVDIEELHRITSLPVITVTRDRPDMAKICNALKRLGTSPGPGRRKIPDWKVRLDRLERTNLIEVDTGHKPLHVGFAGIREAEAKGIVRASTVRGAVPEPLRLAHMIARTFATGSSGKHAGAPAHRRG